MADASLAAVEDRIATEFPDFNSFGLPKPLSLRAVQDLLHIIRACRLERERVLKLYGDRFDFD